MSRSGSIGIFFSRPISGTLLVIAILVLFLPLMKQRLKRLFLQPKGGKKVEAETCHLGPGDPISKGSSRE
ncbi:MAG: hypothetical protein MUP27_12560, partial [Desulfobacterales bacterium]|nr:hypothetical protein [Desulfobacterales bacterium]